MNRESLSAGDIAMSRSAMGQFALAAALAGGILAAAGASAQSLQPQLPPGISIGPRPPPATGTLPPGGGTTQGAQGQQQPQQPQDGPGCTYRDNKLELLV